MSIEEPYEVLRAQTAEDQLRDIVLYLRDVSGGSCPALRLLDRFERAMTFLSSFPKLGVGPGSPEDWHKLLNDYHFANEAEALAWPHNPVDNLAPLAAAGIPVIHVAATEDEVVPICENTDVLEPRYRALGGTIEVIRHPGKHHPHGLEDPTPIIDFILKHRLN